MQKPIACPDAEQLAALADGRVIGAERRRLLAHVDSCPECFQVFSEVCRFLEETAEGKVVTGRFGRKAAGLGISLAAAAALLVAIFQIPVISHFMPWAPPRLPASADLLDPLFSAVPPGSLAAEIDLGSQLGFAPDLSLEAVSFRTGGLVVDLHVALKADDVVAMDRTIGSGLRLARSSPQAAELVEHWERLRGELRANASPAELLDGAGALESSCDRRLSGLHCRLGRWAETGRLATGAQQTGLLNNPPLKPFLDSAIGRFEAGSAVRELLLRIQGLAEQDAAASNREQLLLAFEDLRGLF